MFVKPLVEGFNGLTLHNHGLFTHDRYHGYKILNAYINGFYTLGKQRYMWYTNCVNNLNNIIAAFRIIRMSLMSVFVDTSVDNVTVNTLGTVWTFLFGGVVGL